MDSSTAWSAYMMGVGLLPGPLTGGDPVRGLLTGLTMAVLTGGTFALVQRVRRCLRPAQPVHPQRQLDLQRALG